MRSVRLGARVLAWLVITGAGGLILLAVAVPRLGGATPYVVLTGSMRPMMPPGTLVVVRPVRARDIGVGDVVTYQLRSGEPAVVTHRVVSVRVDRHGRRSFLTQGDSNPSPDAAAVRPVQVKGLRWYSVPYAGYATTLVTGQERRTATIAVATGLFLYAVVMFLSAAAERRARPRSAVLR
ncbi:MAG: signal peptidase I [Marmoricola sp.]